MPWHCCDAGAGAGAVGGDGWCLSREVHENDAVFINVGAAGGASWGGVGANRVNRGPLPYLWHALTAGARVLARLNEVAGDVGPAERAHVPP